MVQHLLLINFTVVMVRKKSGKTIFFSVREKLEFCIKPGKGQGILSQVREILNSTSKSAKSQVKLGLGKGFLAAKGNVGSKAIYNGIDFCGLIAGFIGKEFSFCSQ